MYKVLLIIGVVLFFVFPVNGQTEQECLPNSDNLYDRKRTIKQLAKILNKSVPERKTLYRTGFDITDDNGSPAGFFIYDLTDTSNRDVTSTGCIEFMENHIYHFAPFDYALSLSHILILENGRLEIFKSINCTDRGDKLEDVIAYINQKLAKDENKDEILERIKNYRKFGRYFKMDNYSELVCQEADEK